ncbi:MAG: creatininase family protein [Rhodospirillaceae bacterium]|nr:creatininase family protein [Rhodospirillaceae bacterium]
MVIGAWLDLATTDFAAADPARAVAILPVAATEQHGPHLPLGTDAAINRGVLAAALARLDPARWVAVLPAQEVGESLEHAGFPGTLSLSAETVLALWGEIGAAVARAGIRKLILFNSHGGQTGLVDTAAVRLRQRCGLVTVRASTFGLGLPDGLVDPAEAEHGLHGGLVETSVMLALAPHLVRRDAAADFRSTAVELAEACDTLRAEGAIGLGWAAQDLNLAGVTGDAAAATAELGQRILAHWAGRLAALIEDVIALPLSVLQAGPLGVPPQ